ncbi:8379_t:CDS:1, partial [Scutellospora calospora]
MSCPPDCPLLCCNNSIRNPAINCILGECASDEKLDLNICGFKHDEYTMYITQNIADINTLKNEDKTPYFNYPTSRFAYYTLFQDIPVDKLIAQDIQIEVELLAYHGSNRHATFFNGDLEIPKKEGVQRIMPLMNNFYFTIYLALICDIDLAKKKEYTVLDFLRNPNNLNNIEPKNGVKILEKYAIEITCQETCAFTSHRAAICVKFDKNLKMC